VSGVVGVLNGVKRLLLGIGRGARAADEGEE